MESDHPIVKKDKGSMTRLANLHVVLTTETPVATYSMGKPFPVPTAAGQLVCQRQENPMVDHGSIGCRDYSVKRQQIPLCPPWLVIYDFERSPGAIGLFFSNLRSPRFQQYDTPNSRMSLGFAEYISIHGQTMLSSGS